MELYTEEEIDNLYQSFAKEFRINLIRFKEKTHNCPTCLDIDEWHQILDRMIYCLGELVPETRTFKLESPDYIKEDDDLYTEEIDGRTVTNVAVIDEFWTSYFNNVKELDKHLEKCKDEFMTLLKTYFWDLWI